MPAIYGANTIPEIPVISNTAQTKNKNQKYVLK
jgi:hypothetical protein